MLRRCSPATRFGRIVHVADDLTGSRAVWRFRSRNREKQQRRP